MNLGDRILNPIWPDIRTQRETLASLASYTPVSRKFVRYQSQSSPPSTDLLPALACDLRVMADSADLKQSNTSYGPSIPAGGTFTLPRLVGLARALEISMLDEPISAVRALELGLVNKVVPQTTLLNEAQELADRVARMPIVTLSRVKRLMNQSFYTSLEDQLESERQEIAASANSVEGREGIASFLEKRKPHFMTSVS
ncbi:MAG TPA: enoyl-CoA hydratase-related protein [Anaerolineae bacterium]|nr:enoyl-CoA hydratase-related protein [Anaerolineae bacterium]